MSQHALEAAIGRAILDEAFRLALFADPEKALAAYDLSEDEAAALKSVDAESTDACAIMLGERVLQGLAVSRSFSDQREEAGHDRECANRNLQP